MKKQVISTILIVILLMSMAGCGFNAGNTNKAKVDKQAAAAESQRSTNVLNAGKPANAAKAAVQQKDKNNAVKAAGVITVQGKAKDTGAVIAQPKKRPSTVSVKKTGEKAKASEYFSNTPLTSIDTVQISPSHVYYKGSELYMDAFVYNGYQHTIFNIRNISIRISNKSGVIAKANFNGMGNMQIAPKSYIVWTFVFGSDMVMKQNADLGELKTEFQCDNSY